MALSFSYITNATCNLTPEEMKLNAQHLKPIKKLENKRVGKLQNRKCNY